MEDIVSGNADNVKRVWNLNWQSRFHQETDVYINRSARFT